MAEAEAEQSERTIAVPLRRLLTGVSRTQRAPSAIPRIKRYVLRHIESDWRDAIWDEDRGEHRVWIDDFLNKTIWSRGREHVGRPAEWIKGAEGGRPRLSRHTTSRYGSVLKVKALFVEEPRDGGEPRVEVYLYGYSDKEREEEEARERAEEEGEEEAEEGQDEAPAPAAKKAKEAPAKESGAKDDAQEGKDERAPPAKPAPSKPATAKGEKGSEPAKAAAKKPAAKGKKEGGD